VINILEPYKTRLKKCLHEVEHNKYDNLVVSSTYNLKYLLGASLDTGERMTVLLLSPGKKPKLFIHEMFFDQISNVREIQVVYYKDEMNPINVLSESLSNYERIGIDQTWLCSYLIDLLKTFPNIKIEKSLIVERLRDIKDLYEIDTLRQSARIADAVMQQIAQLQQFPTTEIDVSKTIASFFADHGVNELSFKPIIGFGKNSANPHHTISNQISNKNQPILVDMGGLFKDYCSDITRTFYLGDKNSEFEELYNIVKDTQLQAIDMVKPGVRFSEIDLFVRNSFAKMGYDQQFIHRTGHGIGLELHEGMSIHRNNRDEIQPGMVFSIEPGLYFPHKYGIRIEDIVVATEGGFEVLNNCSKEVQYLEFGSLCKI